MNKWPKIRLDQCSRIVTGATPSTSVEEFWNGDICWATPKDLSDLESPFLVDTPRKITRSGLENCAAEVLPVNSVLFSSRAPIGHVAINRVPTATNQGFKSFIPNTEKLTAAFLFHWLRANRPYLESLGNGATFKEVSKATVSRIEIELPPISEQLRITTILDKTETVKAKRRLALAKLDSLTKSVFNFYFGSPSTAFERFSCSNLGELTEFIDYRGISPNKQLSGVRLITARNIKRGYFSEEPKEFIPANEYEAWMTRGMPRAGDVLFTTEGHTLGSAAKLPPFDKAALAQRLIALQPRSTITSDFLLHFILTPTFQAEVIKRATGSAARGISSKQLAVIKIPIPPLDLQKKFASEILLIEKLKKWGNSSLEKLETLFSSLQHRAFQGEL